MPPRWTRSSDVPHPSVWRRFEGRKAFPNGKKPRFRVQDYTEDMWEDLLNNMQNHFLVDEPLSKALGIRSDEVALAELEVMWRDYTKQKLVLVCLLENKDELGDDTLPTFVGCNVTGIAEPDTPHEEVRSEGMRKILQLLEFLHVQRDCFKYYDVSEVLYALGLSVDRRFRGQGIGLEIVKARFDMGRAVGLRATATVFTAIESQKIAEDAGFETIYEIPYSEYKVDGEVVFKGIPVKTVKVMAARIT